MTKPEGGRRRVLVVEDNLDTAITTVMLLRSMGHEAESATNGFAALATARTFRPEVVLLDVGLPDTNGWEVARQLRRETAPTPPRIIAITGRVGDEARQRSLDAGCEAHLLKPLHPDDLEALLQKRT